MGEVRPAQEADLVRMAEIHLAAIGHAGNTVEEVTRGYVEKLPELLFARPYAEFASPSLVFEENGEVHGFVLVTCQPAVFAGERVWMASAGHLMVEPESRSSFAAIHLLRGVSEGPQDGVYVDRSNTQGRTALKAAGFEQLPAYSIRWSKVFESSAVRAQRLAHRFDVPWQPAMRGAQAAERVGRRILRKPSAELPQAPKNSSTTSLTVDHVLSAEHMLTGFDLHPEFSDADHVREAWDLMRRSRPNSTFVSHAVVNRRDLVIGWYIVEITDTGWGDVVQMIAIPGQQRAVLLHLLHQVKVHGAVIVEGDLPLDMLFDAADFDCQVVTEQAATSVHSRNPKIVETFQNRRAFLSQLEGEFLMRPPAAVPR